MKKIFAFILTIILAVGVFTYSVSAATNVYPQYQTINGVTMVRCTYYAWQQVYDKLGVAMPNFGDAKNWLDSAVRNGYSTGSVAAKDSVAVYQGGTYGHVAYVTSVNNDKMTINEGGMFNASGTAALNGTGIRTGATVNSTIGVKKDSYSSYTLIGFIYFNSSGSGSTTNNVNIKNDTIKNNITNTNAILWGRVDKPSSYAVTKIGIRVRKDGSTYDNGWSKYEAPSKNYVGSTYMQPYYDLNSELKIALTHATKYYYQIYALVNGKEYWSSETTFTTTGSHLYSSWTTTTAATCTAAGTQTRKCSCGKTETKAITALGHSFSQSFTIDKTATCAEAGSKSKHCTRCNAKSEITAIPVLTTHSFDGFVTTKQPTCTDTGTFKTTCTVCKKSWFGTESALGHDFSSTWTTDKIATCAYEGSKSHHCTRCDAKSDITAIKSLSHQWDEWETTKEPTTASAGEKQRVCKRDGCNEKEVKAIAKLAQDGHTHKYDDWVIIKPATCIEDGMQERKCTICAEKESQSISKTEHIFGEWVVEINATEKENGLEKRVCSNCKAEETRVLYELIESVDGQTKEEILEQNNLENIELDNNSSTNSKVDKVDDNNSDESSSNEDPYLVLFISSAALLVVLGAVLTIILIRRKNK